MRRAGTFRLLARDRRGAAAAEMALVLPLLMVLLFGTVEIGNYFMDQHILEKGVRDGARYAARQSFTHFSGCSGTPGGTVEANTKTMVQKGSLDSSAADLLPNWTAEGAVFSVTASCVTTVSSQTMSGIYKDLGNGAVRVEVSATLPYRSVLGVAGFKGVGLNLHARQTAAVAGI